MLVALTFGVGLQVNRDHLMAVLHDYSLLGRALLANFVIVPILGVLFVRFFHVNTYVATGILLMAIAPGALFVILSTRKKGESLGFAVSLAFIMPALSVITVPLSSHLVLPADEAVRLPIMQFTITLVVFQLVPLLAGAILADRVPTIAPKLGRPITLVFLASLVVLVVLLGPRLARDVASVYGSNGIWAMLCIVILSLVTGWLLGGPNPELRRTLGTATTLRKVGLATLVATSSFLDTEVTATVLTYFLVQFITSTLVGVYYTRTATATAKAPAQG